MGLEHLRVLCHVKFENTNVLTVLTGKQVASVRKDNFSTLLNGNVFVGQQSLFENVHHPNSVSETNY